MKKFSMRKRQIVIDGLRIFLKILRESDATSEHAGWLNNPEVNRYLATKKATVAGLRKYIQEKNESPDALFFGIFFKENEKFIGTVKLEPIEFLESRATVAIMIGDKDYWNKGLGTETIKLMTKYVFQELNLNEVNLGVVSENKVAVRAYEKAGLRVCRIDEKSKFYDNMAYDNLIMSIKKEVDE